MGSASRPALSIVIPIGPHNDPDRHVSAMARQSADMRAVEVVLVDGWGRPEVAPAVQRAIEEHADRADVRFVQLPPTSRAATLNHGLAVTSAPLVLFLGDDFIAQPQLVQTHLDLHAVRPEPHVVGIGPGLFPEGFPVNPFMHWLEVSGRLYGVSFVDPPPELIRKFFFNANTSIKRAFLDEVGHFDEDFPYAAWDDFELGVRLFRAGMEIAYLPEAVADHEHDISLADRKRVMRLSAESALIFERKYPARHAWHEVTGVSPLRLAAWNAKSWARARLRPSEANRDRRWRSTLDRTFAASYRRARRHPEAIGRVARADQG